MTSSTGTDEHPEVADISAFTDGLLPPDRTADMRQHIASCDLCDDVRASLDEIRSLLGTLPGPARMPADVASRIEAALAAEALLDATAPHESATVPRETAVSRPSVPVSRETTETAETGKADGAPETTARPVTDRPHGRPRAATGPGRQKKPLGRVCRSPKVLLGTTCAAAVLGVGGLFMQIGSDNDGAKPSADGSSDRRQSKASSLSAENLKTRVHEILAAQKPTPPSPEVKGKNSPDVPLRADEAAIPSCVQAGTGRSEAPLAAKKDTYAGTPAYVVVLPHPSDSSLIDAFVIDSACTSKSPSSPGTVLAHHTYPRH